MTRPDRDGRSPAADARLLRRLHVGGDPVLVANCWDCASAGALEKAGFPVLGTTSHGIAATLGLPDGEVVPVDVVFDRIARIAGVAGVPLTVDLEAGFGLPADELVERMVAAGAVGVNLEDSDPHGGGLVPPQAHAERIHAVREAGAAAGVDVVVNARTDVLMKRSGATDERLAEACARGAAYRDAGADCVFPIGSLDEAGVDRLVRGIGGPVNVVHWPGTPSIPRLAQLGVARVSFAARFLSWSTEHLTNLGRRLVAGDDAGV